MAFINGGIALALIFLGYCYGKYKGMEFMTFEFHNILNEITSAEVIDDGFDGDTEDRVSDND